MAKQSVLSEFFFCVLMARTNEKTPRILKRLTKPAVPAVLTVPAIPGSKAWPAILSRPHG